MQLHSHQPPALKHTLDIYIKLCRLSLNVQVKITLGRAQLPGSIEKELPPCSSSSLAVNWKDRQHQVRGANRLRVPLDVAECGKVGRPSPILVNVWSGAGVGLCLWLWLANQPFSTLQTFVSNSPQPNSTITDQCRSSAKLYWDTFYWDKSKLHT